MAVPPTPADIARQKSAPSRDPNNQQQQQQQNSKEPKPLTDTEKKTVAERKANFDQEHKGKNERNPLKAAADNKDIEAPTQLGQSTGPKLKQLTHLLILLAKEAAEGLRPVDRVKIGKGSSKPIYEYEVSKGVYEKNRPNTPGFAQLATSKLTHLHASMCKSPNADVKKLCDLLASTAANVVSYLTGKTNKMADALKDLVQPSAFIEEEAAASALAQIEEELKSNTEYKIYGGGAHHEYIVCQALKAADLSQSHATLRDFIRAHFDGLTNCDNAISKWSSTNEQWWSTIGARWNDVPCKNTDAAVFQDWFVDTCYDLIMNPTMHRGHHGDRAYWHSMTNAAVRANCNTQGDIVDAIVAEAQAWLAQATTVDGDGAVQMKPFLWNIGRVAHMIGDSFACGHVARESTGRMRVMYFQDYDGQKSSKHGDFDKDPVVGTHAGTVRAVALTQDIVKIFFHEASSKITGAYTAATPVGGASGSAELAAYLRAEVYPFFSNEHRDYSGLGCQVKSTVAAGTSDCPQNLSPGTADPANICPDFPRAPAGEFH